MPASIISGWDGRLPEQPKIITDNCSPFRRTIHGLYLRYQIIDHAILHLNIHCNFMSKQQMMAGCLAFLLGGAMSKTYAQATIKGTISDPKVKNLYLGMPVADSFRNDTIRVKDGK